MAETVIRAEGLGKRYRVGERERYLALRDVLARAFTAPFRSRNGNRRPPRDYIWALRDVSFGVKQGEVVGLIGRNGAGKTTLLKILSRITKPTAGVAEIHGRVGSLLEVGTGFHPELTGRENVYLSGAILGMGKAEIDRKFDEIVAFAEVERFLDSPLKHYSSGMQMRLAFAVAAHLEPEILLVDEVLAVGDLNFQKKCLGKMQEVSSSGRTIVFVSHQLNQIRRLCERVFWIDGGSLQRDGLAPVVVNEYEAACLGLETDNVEQAAGPIAFRRWIIENSQSNELNLDETHETTVLRFRAHVRQEIRKGILFIALRSKDNTILWSNMYHELQLSPGLVDLVHSFERLPLNPGVYVWEIRIFDGHHWFQHLQLPEFSVISKDDSNVFDDLKGCLNLSFRFELQARAALEVDAS
jgi:ABC-type polysaccharide/polyol phosphate transport system ATPase subunit